MISSDIKRTRLWRFRVANFNYILKVKDAKLADVQKALQQAGIQTRSILEVFKEEEKITEEAK